MPYNLSLNTATFGAGGKFGQALTGGYGSVVSTAIIPANRTYTVEAWAKTTNSSLGVLFSQNGLFYVSTNYGTTTVYVAGAAGNINLTSGTKINDGVLHHIRLCVDGTPIASGGTGVKLFIDGVLSASTTSDAGGGTVSNGGLDPFGVGILNTSYPWNGTIDEVAVWNSVKSTANFTPPTAQYTGSESGLVALYHLESDGTDSAGAAPVAATGVTLTGPSGGVVNVSSALFTVALSPGGSTSGNVTVTPASTGAGSFSPASVVLSTSTPTATFTFTPTALGTDTVSVTNSGTLSNPSGIAYVVTNAATAPTAPTMGAVTLNGSTATVPFSAPASNGGASITSYTVGCYKVSDNSLVTSQSVGASPATFSGLANGVAVYFTAVATNSVGPGPQSAASNSVTPTSSLDTTKVVFSPGNWVVGPNSASSINPGAYFRTQFTGNTLNLIFDMTGVTGSSGTIPSLMYRVNGAPWVVADIAATFPITIPTGEAPFPRNTLEVVFKSADGTQGRWTTLGAIVKWIDISGGATLSKPAVRPLAGIYFGDSITEGSLTISNAYSPTYNSGANLTWAYHSAELLGAEAGIVGFGSQGIGVGGLGGVPAFSTAYSLVYPGNARVWPAGLDYIAINQGTNDGAGTGATGACTTLLNNLLAAIPSNTKIFIVRPFNGNQAGAWTAAIGACTSPSRCTYIDTTGFFTTSDSYDGLHPNAYAHQTIAEQIAVAIRTGLATTGATSTRTVSITLADTVGPLANLAGLSVAFYDQTTPGSSGAPMYKSEAGTTNGSGVLTFQVQSTLSAAASGRIEIRSADGRHYNGVVAVS